MTKLREKEVVCVCVCAIVLVIVCVWNVCTDVKLRGGAGHHSMILCIIY